MKPPFRRVLVANRGEIAVRVMRACRELGIETVAVYSDVDASAVHVRAADRAIRLGPASPGESYLAIDRVIAAAIASGADAIHPGYGFLSERAEFAEAVIAAGVVFIGPTPATLAGLGDKLAARRMAREAGIEIVPGTFHPAPIDRAADADVVLADAERIGWPLLVKAAAGGGGRGMRRVDRRADLPNALVAASHEARTSFGDGAVYLEQYVEIGRHIEVQLLGDDAGTVVALGERDCSVQRRHQKLVEEAPAPGLSREQRIELHARGVTIARAVGLRNAATAEFLFTPAGDFWFLEVNARLQVEHGVTELVTGLDLVHEQLRIAAGQPLTDDVLRAAEAAADPSRHAIEVRISAEDPAREFAPVPGLITLWDEAGGPGVRVDAGVSAGWRVPSEYDPLLAKLLTVAPDRDRAIARMERAIDECHVGGIQTTLPFHRWLMAHPPFREAALRTDLVARDWDGAKLRSDVSARAAGLAADAVWAGTGNAPLMASATRPPLGDGATERRPASRWREAALREATDRWP
jgi:acetyl/propionyl-CoA carboxylase alpha subunit